MNHSFQFIFVRHDLTRLLPNSKKVDAILGEDHEVISIQQEALNWRLPELISFVPVLDQFALQVDHEDIESIYSNALITNDDVLRLASVLVSLLHDLHIAVANVELVVPVY